MDKFEEAYRKAMEYPEMDIADEEYIGDTTFPADLAVDEGWINESEHDSFLEYVRNRTIKR